VLLQCVVAVCHSVLTLKVLSVEMLQCRVLQCVVAVCCCSVSQCVDVEGLERRDAAVSCVTVCCCSVVVAVCYSVLTLKVLSVEMLHYRGIQCVAVCCSVLQCVAVCCSVSQRVDIENFERRDAGESCVFVSMCR